MTLKQKFLIALAAIIASLVSCGSPAQAGSFSKPGTVLTEWWGMEGGAWESLIETTYVTEFCIGINFIDRVESGTAVGCDPVGSTRNAVRWPTDVFLIDWFLVIQFSTNASDECAFRFAITSGTVGISDELEIGIINHDGGTVLGPIAIGFLLPAGEALYFQARETDQSGDCGPSLGKQNLFIRYTERP